jgi:type I restriction enzyme R subunit
MTTDTSEKGLETLIVSALTGQMPGTLDQQEARGIYGGAGYVAGDPTDYDRDHAVDLAKLLAFLEDTQSPTFEQIGLTADGPSRQKFLARLQGEIAKRGVIEVLRRGVSHGPAHMELFYGTPSPGNLKAVEHFAANTANCVTAKTRPSSPWIWRSSSTACPWQPSS